MLYILKRKICFYVFLQLPPMKARVVAPCVFSLTQMDIDTDTTCKIENIITELSHYTVDTI